MNKSSGISQNNCMLILFFRSIIIFLILLVVVRLMGKRQIGEMQPFELVITLIIADLATIPMADASTPLLYGVVGIVTLFILHQIISFLDRYFSPMSDVLAGTPTVVINSNGVDFVQLKKQNLGVDDILEGMRGAGCASIENVAFAVVETNGKLSVLLKNPSELKEYGEGKSTLPVAVVVDGKFEERKLKMLGADREVLLELLRQEGEKLSDVELATMDQAGKVYLQVRKKGYRVYKTDFEGGQGW